MNSHLLSDGKKYLVRTLPRKKLLLGLIVVLFTACSGPRIRNQRGSISRPPNLVNVSLKPDSEAIKKIRRQTPDPVKSGNDDLRQVMSFFGDYQVKPQRVRSRYQRWIRKKRAKARSLQRRHRDNFNKQARKDRKKFLADQRKVRDHFLKKKVSREDRRHFFDELDLTRRNFFSEQKEVRREMDANVRESSRELDYEARELSKLFNEEHRAYTRRYKSQLKKIREQKTIRRKKIATKPSVEAPLLIETGTYRDIAPSQKSESTNASQKADPFKAMDAVPGVPLKMGTKGKDAN